MKKINNEVIDAIVKDRSVRQKVTQESFWLFFLVYFAHYIKYELAEFHEEIINIIQKNKDQLVCITAFRGSGKSTIITTASTLWSIPVSYTHLRAHETDSYLVCRLLLE